ncbi:unnamed protein product [Ectocarpus sp. 8 AP-2014]
MHSVLCTLRPNSRSYHRIQLSPPLVFTPSKTELTMLIFEYGAECMRGSTSSCAEDTSYHTGGLVPTVCVDLQVPRQPFAQEHTAELVWYTRGATRNCPYIRKRGLLRELG